MRRAACPLLAFLVLLVTVSARAGDWPQFRHDAARAAASSEQLADVLSLQWVRHLPEPRPAFPGESRLRYDASYEPVVMNGRMFVPSMVSDSVTALDAATGAEQWQFFAEGPVRFAPAAWEGRVYFASDDGCLYCVSADEGRLEWKFRWVPADQPDRKVLGNLRLVSLWPARGAPVVHDSVVYFGAGIWAKYGVSVHALDARTGRVIWSNTTGDQIPEANMDHGTAYFAGLTPHGYLAVVNNMLVVPCGAQLPAFLDLKTGKPGPYTMGWGGRNGLPKGTWFVAGAGHYLAHGGDLYDIARPNDETFGEIPAGKEDFKPMLYAGGFTRVRIDPTNHKDLGTFTEPVFDSGVMYESGDGVAAYDLADGQLRERGKSLVSFLRRSDTYPDKWEMAFREVWRVRSPLKLHIKAGTRLYLGGPDLVQAVDARTPTPAVAWEAPIEGTPQRMLAAAGRLFVVTREGAIYAFGGEKRSAPMVYQPAGSDAPPADAWTRTAADILRVSGCREGYALALGAGSGRLVEELARQSGLDVIAIEPDPARIASLRKQLQRAGLYGTRVSLCQGEPLTYPLPPFFAQLVVCEDWSRLSRADVQRFVKTIVHPLRPYGGMACMAVTPGARQELLAAVTASRIPRATARPAGSWLLVSREGPLPGSADWTHAEADAANTGASADRAVKGPLELLWFDSPRRWFRTSGTTLVRVCAGRVLMKSERLSAIDAFTGRRMWDTVLPFRHTLLDQVVALDDAIYVAGGDTCLIVDPATGQIRRELEVPEPPGRWANLRVWQDLLVAQKGASLVALDRGTGRTLWKQESLHPDLSVALGGGRVFCADIPVKRRGEQSGGSLKTRAFDLRTGKLLWEIAGGSDLRYCASLDLVVTKAGVLRACDGALVSEWPKPPQTVPAPKPDKIARPLFVVDKSVILGTAESFTLWDLATGGPVGDETAWVRRGCTVPRASANFLTTRFRGNAACIDLATREVTMFWNVRNACSNALFPADGVLNMPSMTGGCTCNYLPMSQAYVNAAVLGTAAAP